MKKSLLTILCTLLSVFSWAQGTTAGDGSAEAYAVLTDNQDVISEDVTGITYGKTLTFYYDTNMSSHSGAMSVGPFVEHSDREWNNVVNYITSVVFDESFANYTALTSTAQWFSGCSYLSSISGINNLKTDNVTDMHDMFVGCNFTTLDLSSFNTSNVTNMGYMFSGCSNMTSIDLSSFNTVKVASMNSMFHGCYALKTIYVGSEWTTSNVTESSEMFYGCSNLVGGAGTTYNANKIDYTYAHIDGGENNPGYFTDKNAPASYVITVTSYGNGQVSVEGVPEVVEDGKKAEVAVTAGSSLEMFFFPGEGYQLDSLMVDGINVTADVVPATEQSAASYTLNNINAVHNVITYFGEKASYNEAYAVLVSENNKVSLTLYYDGNKSRHSEGLAIGLDEMMTSQQFLGNREYIQEVTIDSSFVHCELTATISMFAEFSALTTINDLKYLKTDKVTNMWRMFYACPKLTSLDVSGFNTANVTNMEAMFEGCSSLASLDVSGFNTANVTTMQRMFMGCRALETIDVSHFNTEKVTDMGSMFESCGALRSIDVSHFNTANVTNMGNMFVNCAGLTSLDVTNFNTSNVTNLFSIFSGCTGLTTLDLSSFNTAKVTDMDKTFLNCSALTTIYAGSEWTTASVTDGSDPFAYCTRLVGGKGTTYSADHWDYTYARIDGGPNSSTPGYFTDKNAPITVAAPEFRFEGDNLTMTTETQNAGIFYKVADLPSMAEAVVDSVVNSLIVTADGQSTYYDQPFELKKAAVVKAIAIIRNETATFVSDTTTMVYDYEAWVNLKAAVSSGTDLYSRAQGNPNVDTQLLEDLQWALNEGDMIYNNRAQMDSFEATHFTQRINELCAQIEAQMAAEDEPYAVLSDNNTVLTFYYDTNKSAYREAMGVGPISFGGSAEWSSYASTITSVIFDSTFANCTTLTSTAYWFNNMERLTSITGISNLNTTNVTDMGGMFWSCSNLTNVDVSGFNTANVTDMQYMFSNCESLTELDVSGFNTENVTSMVCMFAQCRSLTNLDVSRFNTDKVTNMRAMFTGCNITSLDLSRFNTANVSNMAAMFSGCSALTTIYCGDGWSTAAITDGIGMFGGCSRLVGGAGTTYSEDHTDHTYAHIDGGTANPGYFTDKNAPTDIIQFQDSTVGALCIQNWDTNGDGVLTKTEAAAVTSLGDVFKNQNTITSFDELQYFTGVTVIAQRTFEECTELTSVVFPSTIVSIEEYAFWNCRKLKNAELPEGLKTIGQAAFYCCDIESTVIPSTLTSIGVSPYFMNVNLRSIVVDERNSNYDSRNSCNAIIRTSTNELVQGCLTTQIPDNIVTIGQDAFRALDIQSVILPNTLKTIGICAFQDSGIKTISFPSSLESVSSYAFNHCQGLTEIVIPASLTNVRSSTFTGCVNVVSVTVDTSNPVYDSRDNCNAIIRTSDNTLMCGFGTTVIPSSVTSLASECFRQHYEIKEITIPEGITSIGTYAFTECYDLEKVTSYVTNPFAISEDVFYSQSYESATLNVPHGTKSLYEAADGWKNFKTIVEMNAPVVTDTVATPTFWWSENDLTISSETGDADIYYSLTSVDADGEGTEANPYNVAGAIRYVSSLKADSVPERIVYIKGRVSDAQNGYDETYGNGTFKISDDGKTDKQFQIYRAFYLDSVSYTSQMTQIKVGDDVVIRGRVVNYRGNTPETAASQAYLYSLNAPMTKYERPVSVTRDVIIRAYAAKQGMITSDTIELNYPYEAWQNLYEACAKGKEITYRALRSPRVPEELVRATEARIDYCLDFYKQRTAEEQEIRDMTNDLLVHLAELDAMMRVPASYSNYVLTANEDATMAEIVEQYGSYYGNEVAAIVWNSSVPMTESDLQRFTSNPNLLIYAQSESLVPANRNNVVINGVAKNVVLTTTETGNCNFYAPEAFTAEAIQYTRTFNQQTQIGVSRGWETIALPFTVQIITHEQRGVIAPFGNTASNTHFWLRRLTSNGLQAVPTIEANTAYLISMPNSEEYVAEYNLSGRVTFSAENATVPMTEIVKDESADYVMTPCFTNAAAKQGIYVLNVGEQRSGYPEGSIFESNYRAVLPFQAYVEHKGSNPAPPYFIVGDLGGDTTGIMDNKRETITNNDWYTLDGRKLQGKPTQKGVYITNGKKVIIK